jgi:hypothetical protein
LRSRLLGHWFDQHPITEAKPYDKLFNRLSVKVSVLGLVLHIAGVDNAPPVKSMALTAATESTVPAAFMARCTGLIATPASRSARP